jgi:hypothetical protein
MWQKLKEQIPAIVVTALLVVGAAAYMVHHIAQRQQADLAPLRAQNAALADEAAENRRQIAALNQLLKDTLAQRESAGVRAEGDIEKLNEQRLTRLAEVIAQRVIPAIPPPQSAADAAAAQNEQVDKVAARLAENIRPALAGAIAEQRAATAALAQDSGKRIHELNVGLLATQTAAQDALRLSREIAALYGESFKDEGVVMRLFSLPANLVIDAANLNFVTGDGAQTQRELSAKIEEIEKRLKEVQTLAAASGP